jgi:hypothetical protein
MRLNRIRRKKRRSRRVSKLSRCMLIPKRKLRILRIGINKSTKHSKNLL